MEKPEPYIPTLLVLPFAQGIVFFFMGVALLNEEHALALLALLLLGMITCARIWSRMGQKNIRWKSSVDHTKLFPGESVHLSLHVENPSWLPVWLSVGAAADGAFKPASDDTASLTQASGLLWYQQVDFQWAFRAQRRGVYSLGTASMRIGDLFGFFPKNQPLQDKREVIVYPRLAPLTSVDFPRHDLWGKPGAAHPIQDPVYILGTREYHHSQPARFIHWKTSARYNQLHVKLFEPSRQGKTLLLLDVTQFARHAADGLFEQTLEVMAAMGVRLIQQGYSLGFLTNGHIKEGRTAGLPFSTAPHQAAAFLEMLARSEMKASGTLSERVHRGGQLSRSVNCFYFTFQWDTEAHAISRVFKRRHVPFVCVACVSAEGEAATAKTVYLLDGLRLNT